MSDHLTREFKAHMTSAMNSAMGSAMCEIMKIFEKSLCDHRMELAKKGEEITRLKIKLQKTELELKEQECGGARGEETNTTQRSQWEREPEDVSSAPGKTADVPEIDFEVPDDWCAPLGSETVTKQEEAVSPSVKLLQLYIPLQQVPVIKQEVDNNVVDSHQQAKDGRKTRSGSSLKEKQKHTHDRLLVHNRGTQRPQLRNDIKKLLQGVKEGPMDLTGGSRSLRRAREESTEKEQESAVKRKSKERKITKARKSKSTEKLMENRDEKRFTCRYCKMEFDTQFGRNVHVSTHKRCKGCNKEFPFPSSLNRHKEYCAKLKIMVSNKAQSTELQKPPPCDEEIATAPSNTEESLKKDTKSSSSRPSKSVRKGGPPKKLSCSQCQKNFKTCFRLKMHMRCHSVDELLSCSFCSKKFQHNQALKVHLTKIHQDEAVPSEYDTGLSWTMPLEMVDDNQVESISPSNPAQQPSKTKSSSPPHQSPASLEIQDSKVKKKNKSDKKRASKLRTMGRRCSEGFVCLLCKKVSKTKYALIEHFRIHTGEKPLKCDGCSATFRSGVHLSLHTRKCSGPFIQCEKCDRKFPTKERYDKHLRREHRDWSYFCSICGKGFLIEGCLRNHVQRHKLASI